MEATRAEEAPDQGEPRVLPSEADGPVAGRVVPGCQEGRKEWIGCQEVLGREAGAQEVNGVQCSPDQPGDQGAEREELVLIQASQAGTDALKHNLQVV